MSVTTIFPILRTRDLPALTRFYESVFDAQVRYRFQHDGVDVYRALTVGAGTIGIGHEPDSTGGDAVAMWLYVDDVDAVHARALAAGAVDVAPPGDMPWGERVAQVRDPDGTLLYLGARADDEHEATSDG